MNVLGMKNTYTIYKYENGRKKILAHFHNVVVNAMRSHIASRPVVIHSIWFGSGSREPAESDTALTTPLWTFGWNYGNIISADAPEVQQDGSWLIKFTAKIDASSAYVGTVSEVGLYMTYGSSSLVMGTHALITDAEGNPMTITKTDTEVLYVDIRIHYQLSSRTAFEWNPYYTYLLMVPRYSQEWITIPGLHTMRIMMCAAYPDLMTSGRRLGSAVKLTNSYNESTRKLTCSGGRFGTENQTSQEYVNAIALCPAFNETSIYEYSYPDIPVGWVKFPNSAVFPNRTLSGMHVGTGDGETTEFKPPLNLWVKDTEKIYVDGVLQQRGVDYTCDHKNDLDNLISLKTVNFSILKSELIHLDYGERYNMGCHPLKGGYNKTGYSQGDLRRVCVRWDNTHPLEWEMTEDPQIGNEADEFYLAPVFSTASSSMKNARFTISYSDDETNWTDVGTYTYTSTGTSTAAHTFQFAERISARYWKVTADLSGCSESVRNARLYVDNSCYLKRIGQPIIFTAPPAQDAVITMEADIDRPMKNSNFVLDFNPEFQL